MDKLLLNEKETQLVKFQPQRQSSVSDDKPFKIGDRVDAYDAKGIPEKGTVKWIGKNEKLLPSGMYIVGIHTVSIMCCSRVKYPKHLIC